MALSCSLSLDAEGQTVWWKPFVVLFFEFLYFTHSWVTRLGKTVYFYPFCIFPHLSCFSHCPFETIGRCCTTEPRNFIYFFTILSTRKGHKSFSFLSGLFCGKHCFAIIPVLKRRLMRVISYLPLCALPQEMTSPCPVRTHLTASEGLQQATAHSLTYGLWDLRKLLHRLLHYTIKISFFHC